MGKKHKKLPSGITVTQSYDTCTQPQHRQLEPKLIWPLFGYNQSINPHEKNSFNYFIEIDSYSFPGYEAVYQNKEIYENALRSDGYFDSNYGISSGIKEFWDTFRQSTNILFADSHFDISHFNRMAWELERIHSRYENDYEMTISIYCRTNLRNLIEYEKNFKSIKPQIYSIADISIDKLPNKDLIHDRFAIMDGEIWHCGSTVGGMHGALTAVSRGWPDVDGKLSKFLKSGGSNG